MILRHPGISPTNDLVAKKIFSNPEITCQFIRDMLDLPAKNVTILEGSNIHVLPSLPYSAQDFYTSIDVLAGFYFMDLEIMVRYFITGKAIQQVPYLILILISQLGYLNPQAKR